MTFNVLIKPSDHNFIMDADETILEAGLKHGFILPYSCREGACGTCKSILLQGTVTYEKSEDSILSDEEKAAGMALLCCAKPTSDLIIECREVSAAKDIPIKTLPCRVHKLIRLDDAMVLYLKLPANEHLQFLAGQYIDILIKGGKARSFSLANAPHDDEFLQLHIRNIPNGEFTKHVFTHMKERDILRFKGPLGSFFLREDSDKPLIFIASGTGFAPIKSIIEHALYVGVKRTIHLYWGAHTLDGLYMMDKAREWETHGIKFTPVLSDALPTDNWQGRTGFVHEAVLADYPDLSGYQVYACGAPVVVTAAHRDFTTLRGLPPEEFFSDAFTPAVKV